MKVRTERRFSFVYILFLPLTHHTIFLLHNSFSTLHLSISNLFLHLRLPFIHSFIHNRVILQLDDSNLKIRSHPIPTPSPSTPKPQHINGLQPKRIRVENTIFREAKSNYSYTETKRLNINYSIVGLYFSYLLSMSKIITPSN